jgi:anti-anti-sigma regulatory factor
MRVSLGEVRSDFSGVTELLRVCHEIQASDDRVIDIDMSHVSWMDANMCAPFGAILERLKEESRTITFWNMRAELRDILRRNNFLRTREFTGAPTMRTQGTTIDYQRFDPNDVAAFKEYVAQYLVGKGIPDMTAALQRKFRESIAEIFENAMEHSDTQLGVFACGQYYPRKERLDFSVADRGIGMRGRILKSTGLDLPDERAINWTMEGGNTTRHPREGKPGGLGLKFVREFVRLNKGSIQIVSCSGYWRFQGGPPELRRLAAPFPGTIVNIEINAADTQTYCLRSEVNPEEIF